MIYLICKAFGFDIVQDGNWISHGQQSIIQNKKPKSPPRTHQVSFFRSLKPMFPCTQTIGFKNKTISGIHDQLFESSRSCSWLIISHLFSHRASWKTYLRIETVMAELADRPCFSFDYWGSLFWTLDPKDKNCLRYVGGVDISFAPRNKIDACALSDNLWISSMSVVWETYSMVKLTAPYVAGFLGFREIPFIEDILKRLRKEQPSLFPARCKLMPIRVDANLEIFRFFWWMAMEFYIWEVSHQPISIILTGNAQILDKHANSVLLLEFLVLG